MATEAEMPDEAEEQEKSGGMMKMILMGVGMFIIVLAAQTVAPLISSKLGLAPQVAMQDSETVETGEGDDEGEAAADAPPIYWPLKPAMVVNFAGNGTSSFLQVEMEVMARDQAVIENCTHGDYQYVLAEGVASADALESDVKLFCEKCEPLPANESGTNLKE